MPDPSQSLKLPHIVDALKLCQQHARVAGSVGFARLPRLEGLLSEMDGDARVDIAFAVDEQHRKILTGRVQADVPLTCQRCLGKMVWQLDTGFDLALVWDEEQADQLPKTLDPVLVEDTDVDLYRIVEDEMLLSLPLVPHHEPGTCSAPHVDTTDSDSGGKRENPFQVLATLKTAGKPRKEDSE